MLIADGAHKLTIVTVFFYLAPDTEVLVPGLKQKKGSYNPDRAEFRIFLESKRCLSKTCRASVKADLKKLMTHNEGSISPGGVSNKN